MTVRRRGGSDDKDDLALVDEMVRKSLAVNPGLRQGRATVEVLQGLRDEVLARAKTGPAPAPKPDPGRPDARLEAIEIFLRDKARTFPELSADVRHKIAALQAHLQTLREDTLKAISDLVGAMLQTGLDPKACQRSLAQFRDLLGQLDVTEQEILQRAQTKG
jgi:hypothetical protein